MKKYSLLLLVCFILIWNSPALAKVDLVTLPKRDNVQLTI